jgi:hypothetical protein
VFKIIGNLFEKKVQLGHSTPKKPIDGALKIQILIKIGVCIEKYTNNLFSNFEIFHFISFRVTAISKSNFFILT